MMQRNNIPLSGRHPPRQRYRAVTAPVKAAHVPQESSAENPGTSSRYGKAPGYIPPHLRHRQRSLDPEQPQQERPEPESSHPEQPQQERPEPESSHPEQPQQERMDPESSDPDSSDPESSGDPPSGMFDNLDASYSAFRSSRYARKHLELREALQALLDARPEWIKPRDLVRPQEVEIRHEYAKKIEKRICEKTKDFVMDTVQMVTILIVPMHSLEARGYLSHQREPIDLLRRMESFFPLVRRYTHGTVTMPDSKKAGNATVASTSTKSKRPGPSSSRQGSQKRSKHAPSKKHKQKKTKHAPSKSRSSRAADDSWEPPRGPEAEKLFCRIRDFWRCIYAKTAEIDVAHIIPQTWNDTKENIELTLSVIAAAEAFFEPDMWDEFLTLFADEDNIRSTDKAWNMLCLNKQLHWYLDHRFLSLKCVGIEPCRVNDSEKKNESDGSGQSTSGSSSNSPYEVIIQFHWLKRTQKDKKSRKESVRKVNLHGEGNDFTSMVKALEDFKANRRPSHVEPGEGKYATVRVDTHTPLYSGHVARIKMTKSDAEKCQVMLILAWALSVIAALSGAADRADLPPEFDDSDGDEVPTTQIVEDWVQDQQERYQSQQLLEKDEEEEQRARRQVSFLFSTEPHEPVLALRPITNRPRDGSPGKLSERTQTQTEGPSAAKTEAQGQAQAQARDSQARTVTRAAGDENVRPRYDP